MTENEWNATLKELTMTLNKVSTAAANASDTALLMLRGCGGEPDMRSDVDYFDLSEFMEDLEKSHAQAQKLMERFYKEA